MTTTDRDAGPGSAGDIGDGIYEIAGYRAAVTGMPESAQRDLQCILAGFRTSGPIRAGELPRFQLTRTGSDWSVRLDDEVLHSGPDYSVALGALEFQIVEAALGRDTGLFHLHGASLCAPLQRAGLVLAGASGHGKTTLTLALMLRGFVPFGDDIALLDPDTLQLHGVRRAFHVSGDTWPLLEAIAPVVPPPADMPSGYFVPPQWASDPVPIRWLLFPEYKPQQIPRLLPLTPAETASRILAQTGTLARASRLALSTTTRIIQTAAAYRLLTGDLAESVAVVQSLVSEI